MAGGHVSKQVHGKSLVGMGHKIDQNWNTRTFVATYEKLFFNTQEGLKEMAKEQTKWNDRA